MGGQENDGRVSFMPDGKMPVVAIVGRHRFPVPIVNGLLILPDLLPFRACCRARAGKTLHTVEHYLGYKLLPLAVKDNYGGRVHAPENDGNVLFIENQRNEIGFHVCILLSRFSVPSDCLRPVWRPSERTKYTAYFFACWHDEYCCEKVVSIL